MGVMTRWPVLSPLFHGMTLTYCWPGPKDRHAKFKRDEIETKLSSDSFLSKIILESH